MNPVERLMLERDLFTIINQYRLAIFTVFETMKIESDGELTPFLSDDDYLKQSDRVMRFDYHELYMGLKPHRNIGVDFDRLFTNRIIHKNKKDPHYSEYMQVLDIFPHNRIEKELQRDLPDLVINQNHPMMGRVIDQRQIQLLSLKYYFHTIHRLYDKTIANITDAMYLTKDIGM